MSRLILVCCVVLCVCGIVFGEMRTRFPVRGTFSEDGGYVGRVAPAEEGKKGRLEVFKVDGDVRTRLWGCELDYETRLIGVYVLDGGEYVVTSINRSRNGVALAFYSKEGLIKKYSIQEVQKYQDKLLKDEIRGGYGRRVSRRGWAEWPSFFEEYAGKTYFCVRYSAGKGWMAWEVKNGGEAEVPDEMKGLLDKKGRELALKGIEDIPVGIRGIAIPCRFLGELGDERDRGLFEELLKNERFMMMPQSSATSPRKSDNGERPKNHLKQVVFSSQYRLLADEVLSVWNGVEEWEDYYRRPPLRYPRRPPLHYLGSVEGKVVLPETEKPRAGTLLIYLFKTDPSEKGWLEEEAAHRFCVPLSHLYLVRRYDEEYTKLLPFLIKGIEAGEYWVKVVLDKDESKEHTREIEGEYKRRTGDYENVEATMITVKCGEIAEVGVVDCSKKMRQVVD